MYTQDYDERLPVMFMYCRDDKGKQITCRPNAMGTAAAGGWNSVGYYWHEQVLPYIRSEAVLICSEANRAALNPMCMPYGFNFFWLGNDNVLPGNPHFAVPMAAIQAPTETVLIVDGRGRPSGASDVAYCKTVQAVLNQPCADCLNEGGGSFVYGHRANPTSLGQPYLVSQRHAGGANAVFVDGHAKTMKFHALNDCNNWWDGNGADGPCRKGAK